MITEAFDALITLGWAFLAWLTIFAAALVLAFYTVVTAILTTARALRRLTRWAWRGAPGPTWARDRITARRIARAYKEAA